jgi:hypothetical protein
VRNCRHDHCSTLPADPFSAGDHLFCDPRLARENASPGGFHPGNPWHDECIKRQQRRDYNRATGPCVGPAWVIVWIRSNPIVG